MKNTDPQRRGAWKSKLGKRRAGLKTRHYMGLHSARNCKKRREGLGKEKLEIRKAKLEKAKRGHDPDQVGTGVSCPYVRQKQIPHCVRDDIRSYTCGEWCRR